MGEPTPNKDATVIPKRRTVPPLSTAALESELLVCAEFADGTARGALVPLADFTRHRMAKALRSAAREIGTITGAATSHTGRAPRHAEPTSTPGLALVTAERLRQFKIGHTVAADTGRAQELMAAAECYLSVAQLGPNAWHNPDGSYAPPGGWPWSEADWSPSSDRSRNLAIAAALIAAALDVTIAKTPPSRP